MGVSAPYNLYQSCEMTMGKRFYRPVGMKVLAPYLAFSAYPLVRELGAPQHRLTSVRNIGSSHGLHWPG